MIDTVPGIGIVYGGQALSIKEMTDFLRWLRLYNQGIATYLRYPVASCEFNAAWMDLYSALPELMQILQYQFKESVRYESVH